MKQLLVAILVIVPNLLLQCDQTTTKKINLTQLLSLNVEESDLFDNSNRQPVTYYYPPKKLYNQLPMFPAVSKKMIYLPNFMRNRIFGYLLNEEKPRHQWRIEQNISDSSSPIGRKVESSEHPLGLIAVDPSDSHIYIQYFLKNGKSINNSPQLNRKKIYDEGTTNPSIIAHLKKNGEISGWIGMKEPFAEILKLEVDSNNFLYVLTRRKKKIELNVYLNEEYQGKYEKPTFQSRIKNRNIISQLEYLRPLVDSESISIASNSDVQIDDQENQEKKTPPIIGVVSFRDKKDYSLLERVIYRQNGWVSEPSEIMRTNDFFSHNKTDGSLVLQESDSAGDTIVYKFHNPQGKYLYRSSFALEPVRSSWRNSFSDLRGRLFFIRFWENRYEIYEVQ